MLLTLLRKDLARVRRNPWLYAVHLSLPIVITALIGLAMGGFSKDQGLGRIKLAVVDEDDSFFSGLLRGALNQGEAKKYLEPRFVSREQALRDINKNEISAVVILPKNFTRDYLTNSSVSIEIIKNPAQGFYPAITEEMLRVLVTTLNAAKRLFGPELSQWRDILESSAQGALSGQPSRQMKAIAGRIESLGKRFEAFKDYLFPPLVTYVKAVKAKQNDARPGISIFAFLLPGMASMFLLFLADHAVRDFYREVRVRTLDRLRTIYSGLLPFVFSKIALGMVILLISSTILFGGSAWIFGFHWQRPLAISAVIVAYCLFACGMMAFIAAVLRSERRVDVLSPIIPMTMAFIGGAMFPARQLPPLFRNHISPLMPNYWFIEGVRSLQSMSTESDWVWAIVRLVVLGVVLILAAAWLFQRALRARGE